MELLRTVLYNLEYEPMRASIQSIAHSEDWTHNAASCHTVVRGLHPVTELKPGQKS